MRLIFFIYYIMLNYGRLAGPIFYFCYIKQLKIIKTKKNILLHSPHPLTWDGHDPRGLGQRARLVIKLQRTSSTSVSKGRVTLVLDSELRHLQGAASAELLPRAAPTGVFAWVLRVASSKAGGGCSEGSSGKFDFVRRRSDWMRTCWSHCVRKTEYGMNASGFLISRQDRVS